MVRSRAAHRSAVVDGDVSATPAVSGGRVYFPTWNGSIYCLNQYDGSLVWKVNVEDLLKSKNIAVGADSTTCTIHLHPVAQTGSRE